MKDIGNFMPRRVFLLSILSATGFAMALILMMKNPPMSSGDSIGYLIPIHNWFEGRGYTLGGALQTVFPPGLGLLSYPIYLVLGDVEYSGGLLSVICFSLLIPVSYGLAKDLFGEKTAWLSAFLITFNPCLLEYSFQCLTEIPFALFLLLGFLIYTKIAFSRITPFRSIALSLTLAILYLLRPEGLLIAVSSITSLFLIDFADRGQPSSRPSVWKRLRYPVLSIVLFAVLVSPYLLFLKTATGEWTFSGKLYMNFEVGNQLLDGWDSRPKHLDSPYTNQGSGLQRLYNYVRFQGERFGWRILRNAVAESFFLVTLTIHALIPLGLLWLVYPFVADRRLFHLQNQTGRLRKLMLIYLIFLSPLFVYPFFFVVPRFLLPYSLLMILVMSYMIVQLVTRIGESTGARMRTAGLVASALVALISPLALDILHKIPRIPLAYLLPHSVYSVMTGKLGAHALKASGIWLRENVANFEDLTIAMMINSSVVSFYAGTNARLPGQYIGIPTYATSEEAASLVTSGKARLLLLENDGDKLRLYWKGLLTLWERPELAGRFGLRLVYMDAEKGVQLYAVNGTRAEF